MGKSELNKYVFSLVGLSVVVLVGLIAVVIGMQNYLAWPGRAVLYQPGVIPSVAPAPGRATSGVFARATVTDWGSLPAVPTFNPPLRTTMYALKQEYTNQDFANLAQHFISVTGNQVTEEDNSISLVTGSGDTGLFYLYKPSGSFFYRAKKGLALPAEGRTETEKINAFMKSLWNDGTLQVTSSYNRRSVPGVRYYEVHRDWDKVGLPIVNLLGTFNIADDQKIGLLSILKASSQESDPDIINTDNQVDGSARADDFNTATVGVAAGRIVSIVSNIRPAQLQGSTTHGLITYEDAVARLKKGKYQYLYTSPAGDGAINSSLIYENNAVVLEKVEVRESLTAYLEELPNKPQSQLFPYYVFRGHAATTTGYKVKFVAAVPAFANTVLGVSNKKQVKLLSQTTRRASQQQGTLQFVDPANAPVPAIDQPPGYTPVPQPTAVAIEQQLKNLSCEPPPSPQDLNNVVKDAYGYTYGQYNHTSQLTSMNDWYIIPGEGWDIVRLEVAVRTVMAEVKDGGDPDQVRRLVRLIKDFSSIVVGCPVRISGYSPSLFIYGPQGSSFTVRSGAQVTYSDPPHIQNTWNGVVHKNEVVVNSKSSNLVYYEYTGVKFNRPKNGWTIEKSHLPALSGKIARELQLLATESTQLTHELVNASRHVDGNKLFIALVEPKEIDAKLPLVFSTNMFVVRYHFYITEAIDGETFAIPALSPVRRRPQMAIELGAAAN